MVTDADWASPHFSRKSVSSYVLFLSGTAIYMCTKLQQSLALSSCEPEYMASLAGCCDALFVQSLVQDLAGSAVRLTTVVQGGSSGRRREGAGRLRPIYLAYLWLQHQNDRGNLIEKSIATEVTAVLLGLIAFVKDNGEQVGKELIEGYLVKQRLRSVVPKHRLRVSCVR